MNKLLWNHIKIILLFLLLNQDNNVSKLNLKINNKTTFKDSFFKHNQTKLCIKNLVIKIYNSIHTEQWIPLNKIKN